MNARGFTLIEAVSTMVVVAIMGGVVSGLILRSTRDFTDAAIGGQLHAEVALTMDRVDREIRQIRRKPTVSGAADLTGVTANSIAWNSGGGACGLSLSGGQLLLAEDGGAGAVLATGVTGFVVAAFDESNGAVALPANAAACEAIRRVSVTITMSRNGMIETVRTRVFLRATMSGGVP